MNNQFNIPNKFIKDNSSRNTNRKNLNEQRSKKRDDDLIIEENTIYEIDRDCVERLKRGRRR